MTAGGDHVTSGLATIEQVGRGRVFASTAGIVVFLVAVQATMAFRPGDRTAAECHTAALLGVFVGAMTALAAPTATYRYYVYIHSLRPNGRCSGFARLVFVCSLVLAGLDAVADVLFGAAVGVRTGIVRRNDVDLVADTVSRRRAGDRRSCPRIG
ncbi:hypothetical protein ABZ540_17680 [Nocardia xishanensis]|uniref:hypothetical protein n=1 Tax=Nocardia xishanensis TaxID=238964 RepID=UPI0033CB5943